VLTQPRRRKIGLFCDFDLNFKAFFWAFSNLLYNNDAEFHKTRDENRILQQIRRVYQERVNPIQPTLPDYSSKCDNSLLDHFRNFEHKRENSKKVQTHENNLLLKSCHGS